MKVTNSLLLLTVLLVFSSYSFAVGRTVQLNLAFSIGTKDDNITAAGDYVAAQDAGLALGIVSSGTTTAAGNVTGYSSGEYMLQLTQGLNNNRFLIAFTNASNQTISDKLKQLGNRKILSRTFGNLATAASSSMFLFLRLEYEDADITTRARWGVSPIQLLIKNTGTDVRPQISIEVVK